MDGEIGELSAAGRAAGRSGLADQALIDAAACRSSQQRWGIRPLLLSG